MYHPAAFESAEDSFKGVAIHGLGISGSPVLPILKNFVGEAIDRRQVREQMASFKDNCECRSNRMKKRRTFLQEFAQSWYKNAVLLPVLAQAVLVHCGEIDLM